MSGLPGTALGRYLKEKVKNDLAKTVVTGLDLLAESQLENFLPDVEEKGPLSDDEIRYASALLKKVDLPDIEGEAEEKVKQHLVKALFHLEKIREIYVSH